MPKDFDMCVKAGGRVRTKEMGEGKSVHVCFLKGKMHMGEMKQKAMQEKGSGMNKFSKALAK